MASVDVTLTYTDIQIQNVTDVNVTKNNKHHDDDEQHNDMKQMENGFYLILAYFIRLHSSSPLIIPFKQHYKSDLKLKSFLKKTKLNPIKLSVSCVANRQAHDHVNNFHISFLRALELLLSPLKRSFLSSSSWCYQFQPWIFSYWTSVQLAETQLKQPGSSDLIIFHSINLLKYYK